VCITAAPGGQLLTRGVPQNEIRVRSGNLGLRCLLWGSESDPPVLLLHGNGGHAHWWNALVPTLARGRQLIALDMRGHGDSDWPDAGQYRLEDYELDILAVLDSLASQPVPIVAHSMGGRAAAFFAARHPERVTGIALLDTSLTRTGDAQHADFAARVAGRREGRRYASREEALAAFRFVPEEPQVPEQVRVEMARHAICERRPGEWRIRFDRSVLLGDGHGDLVPLVATLGCPVWIGNGRGSHALKGADRERLEASETDLVLAEFEGAHHFMLSHPEPPARWLVRFLESLERAPHEAHGGAIP
jgi:pimeloyl-ACP methyl ester carboxylesterase